MTGRAPIVGRLLLWLTQVCALCVPAYATIAASSAIGGRERQPVPTGFLMSPLSSEPTAVHLPLLLKPPKPPLTPMPTFAASLTPEPSATITQTPPPSDTPTITLTPTPALVYSEDFEWDWCNWWVGDEPEYSAQCIDGEYEMRLKLPNWIWFAAQWWLSCWDCIIDVDAHFSANRKSGSYGLAFGLDGSSNGYLFRVTAAQDWGLLKVANRLLYPLVPLGSSPHINPREETNHLRVERQGSRISLYVNGYQLATVHDATYVGQRMVGMAIESYLGEGVQVRFDNLVVYEWPEPTLTPTNTPTFAPTPSPTWTPTPTRTQTRSKTPRPTRTLTKTPHEGTIPRGTPTATAEGGTIPRATPTATPEGGTVPRG